MSAFLFTNQKLTNQKKDHCFNEFTPLRNQVFEAINCSNLRNSKGKNLKIE